MKCLTFPCIALSAPPITFIKKKSKLCLSAVDDWHWYKEQNKSCTDSVYCFYSLQNMQARWWRYWEKIGREKISTLCACAVCICICLRMHTCVWTLLEKLKNFYYLCSCLFWYVKLMNRYSKKQLCIYKGILVLCFTQFIGHNINEFYLEGMRYFQEVHFQ